jgi:CubicO group peptidase (beta-lactamase class C family)
MKNQNTQKKFWKFFSIFNFCLIFSGSILIAQEIDSKKILLGEKIDQLMDLGIQKNAFPGAQVIIYKKNKVQLHKAYGFQTYDSLVRVEKNQLYDLASLTKVLASTLAFMKLYELYNIDLDQKVSTYIPLLKRTNKKNTTFRQALSHSAGWAPYIAHQNLVLKKRGGFKNRTVSLIQNKKYPIQISNSLFIHKNYSKKITRRIKKTKLTTLGDYKYSGLWFFLLPKMVENLTNLSFNEFLNFHFYKPLELERLTFLPTQHFPKNEIVPTEIDITFRKELVQGWVHDEAAAMMGGVSGNAGLFANAESLTPIIQLLLQKGVYKGKKYLDAETLRVFTQQAYPNSNNRRGLGFDKPSLQNDSDSTYPSILASPTSFGHSGFTGTFIWVDPQNECFIIFLSNRVYPSREYRALYDLNIRGQLLDYAIQF